MDEKFFIINILIIFLKIITVKCEDINMTLYYTFPPLYEYDDYDRCLYENPSKISTHCLTDIQVIPNNKSELWNNIEEFSRDKNRHFRHDSMIYAVCVNWCEKMLKDINESEREKLYGGLLSNKQLVNYIDDLYSKETGNRIKYNKLINECLNLKFQNKYNLSVTSNIKYCNTNKDKLEIESLDIAFVIVTFILLALNGISSLYDLLLKKKLPSALQTNQYYKDPVKDFRQQLFLSFSVCRNYFRLTKTSYETSQYNKELRFADAFKFTMMLGVISSHLMEFQIAAGLQNTEHLEIFLHRVDKNILINSTGFMQCFFQISGFLLMLNFDVAMSKMKKDKVRYIPLFFRMLFLRYIRLTPLLAYGMFFNSSILLKIGKGPLWRFAAEREYVFCRRNWWINFLYLQNYINVEKSCMPQTWYVAVDLQAFVICSIIMLLCYKYPHKMKIIIGIPIFFATISPAITVFIYDIPGIYFHTPEYFRHFVYFNDEFQKLYVPLQNNLMGYLFGILTAKIFLHFKSKNFRMDDSKVRILIWYIFILIAFALIFSGEIYYRYNVPKILSAIHGSFYKISYAGIFTYVILGIADKIGWMAPEFCNLPIFRVLGRLTYAVLITQVPVLITGFIFIRSPQYQTDQRLILYILGMVTMIYFVAFLITIILELPITALMKILLNPRNQPKNELLKDQNELNQSNRSNAKDDEVA